MKIDRQIPRLLAAALLAGWLSGCSSSTPQIKDTIILEYGMPAALSAEQVFAAADAENVESFSAVLSGMPDNQQAYPPFGTYTAEITYTWKGRSHTTSVPVEVRDTTAPVVHAESEIEIPVDASTWDYRSRIEVSDNDTTTLSIDDAGVEYGVPGTYAIVVTAVDDSQNKTEQMITVTVSDQDADELAQITTEPQETETTNASGGVVEEATANSDASGTVDTSTVPNTARGIAIVNKKHGLPASYAPGEDPEALQQLQAMITAMQAAGLDISNGYSGYRSYAYQDQLYTSYVQAHGQEQADTFSARPGYSEHQTGLAFDLKHGDGSLVTKEEEAAWIRDHAHEYGFIVRYKDGWQDITGYVAEPWHVRYIGEEATDIYESGLSLEEYLGVEGGDYVQG